MPLQTNDADRLLLRRREVMASEAALIGEKSVAHFLFLILMIPSWVNNIPLLPISRRHYTIKHINAQGNTF